MNRVVVCIVSFRHPAQIVACLRALSASDYAAFEVVICENGGPGAYAALLEQLPTSLPGGQAVTCLLAEGNLGYGGGVNRCIHARPEAYAWWVLNPDTEVEPTTLSALLARLERGDCEAVGGTLYHPGGTVQAFGGRWRACLARAESIGHGVSLDQEPDPITVEAQMDYLLGASMLIGRRFLEAAGLMREDYFLYAEEVEWCLRGTSRGMRLGFAPAARVCHGQGGTTGSAVALHRRGRLPIYLDERNKLLVVRDSRPVLLPVAAMGSLVLAALRFARRGAWSQWGHALAGWWAGVRNERGMPPWLC